MENPITIIDLNNINVIIYFLKMFLMGLCTYYTFTKILNIKLVFNIKLIIVILSTLLITFFHTILQSDYPPTTIIFFVLSLSILYSFTTSCRIGYSILVTLSSFSISYILYIISILIGLIPNAILGVQNDIISLSLIYTIQFILLSSLFRLKRFKYGLAFFKKNLNNEYFDLLILNISAIVLFFSILLGSNYSLSFLSNLLINFIILGLMMFIAIQKSLTLYYKHNLLVKDLNETKEELNKRNKEFKDLEDDYLKAGKINHTIGHKQRLLEHKLNELMLNTEIADELDISNKIKDVSKKYFNNSATSTLIKTDIEELDDMLNFLQSECINNNIDFDFKISGNLYHMINTFISKEDLAILLADLIKNSIIAINSSDNVNKSILVKLGLIDNYYSLYVYDSGIEFESNTLSNLGKRPVTTHSDNGGTGFGFMNTFDTLKKYNASLIINEFNPPCTDNYTKSIVIKFDDVHQFIVNSYRSNLVSSN